MRNLSKEVTIFRGHQYAIRKVAANPHLEDVIASASYDMTVRTWRDRATDGPIRLGIQDGIWNMHQEFVVGLDWSLVGNGGWLASCGWDENVFVFDIFQR